MSSSMENNVLQKGEMKFEESKEGNLAYVTDQCWPDGVKRLLSIANKTNHSDKMEK